MRYTARYDASKREDSMTEHMLQAQSQYLCIVRVRQGWTMKWIPPPTAWTWVVDTWPDKTKYKQGPNKLKSSRMFKYQLLYPALVPQVSKLWEIENKVYINHVKL